MQTLGVHLFTALALSTAIGLITDKGWAGYLIGAIGAATLWLMLWFGRFAEPGASRPEVRALDYVVAAAVAVAVGAALFLTVGEGENGVWWSVGVILAGLLTPLQRRSSSSARSM